MKNPSSELHALIQALSSSEKRYIRLHADAEQGIALMDAILKQNEYNEKLLKQDNVGAPFLKNLAVNKKHLFQLILKMLDRFSKQDPLSEVEKGIRYARILFEKGLINESRKQVLKYKKIAYANELFEQVILLLKIEKEILSKVYGSGDVESVFEEEVFCLEQINNVNEYWILLSRVYDLQMKNQKIRTPELDQQLSIIESHEKLKDEKLAATLQSKMYFYQANATIFFIQRKAKKALQINRQYLQFFESENTLLQRFPERYLSILNNYLIDCLESKNLDAFHEGIEKLNSISQQKHFQKIKDIDLRIFRQRFLLEINWRLSIQDYKNGVLLIPELEKGLERFGTKIEKHHLLTFYYLVTILYFGNRQYHEALNWVNKIINDTREKVVKEIYQFARVLNLLIHERLGNVELLEAILPTTRRYLRLKRDLYKTEKLLFKYLKEKINLVDKKEIRLLNQNLQTQLFQLKKDPEEVRVFNYIDLISWVEGIQK